MRIFYIALALLLIFSQSSAQENTTTRTTVLSAQYIQIKESANFGLVFSGPGLNYGMEWTFINEERVMTYEYDLGLGILFSREIPALGFYLKPVDFAYMFKFPVSENNFIIGPSLKMEYNYNLYPDLQSGFDYWFTNIGLGFKAKYDFNYGNSAFILRLNSSLVSLVSRQPDYRDPYFYDIGFKYAIRHLHEDLVLGGYSRFNTTKFELLWKPKPGSRFTLGYIMKYSGYYQSPELKMVSHGIKLIIDKKKR